MKIETKLNFKEYLGLMFTMTYRKPLMVFFTTLGLILVLGPLSYFLGFNIPYETPPYLPLLFGILIVGILPFSIYMGAKKNFSGLGKLQERIVYEFSDEKIILTGESFDYEMDWIKVNRVLELKNWVIIYQSKTTAFIIPRQSFGENIDEFRRLVRRKNVRNRLRNQY